MRFILGFILGLLAGYGASWYLASNQHNQDARRAEERIVDRSQQMRERVEDKLSDLSLDKESIKADLARAGEVVRRKSKQIGNIVADSAADAKVTAAIKGKLVADPDLSALSISVSTTRGVVTLSGLANSVEDIRKAIQLALQTDGVIEVKSTLQVRQTEPETTATERKRP